MLADEIQPAQRDQRRPDRVVPRGPCYCCGKTGHFKINCSLKDSRCEKCRVIGHTSAACNRFVKKDAVGRITTRVTDAPKGLTIETREDRTNEDKVDTAANVLKLLKDTAQKRGKKSREKRDKKKREAGWIRKRNVVEHPVSRVEEMSSSSSDDEDESSEDEELLEQVEKMFRSARMLQIDEEDVEAPVIWCNVEVNGHVVHCVADSGSGRSICSMITAEKLGLKFTEVERNFKGLGRSQGRVAQPVKMVLKGFGRVAEVTFNVVPQEDFQTVIGVIDLKKFNVFVDPIEEKLRCRSLIEVSMAHVTTSSDQQPQSVVSGVDERLSDEDLLKKAKEWVMSQTVHLEECRQDQIWDALVEYKECWLRPRSGQFNGFKGSFEVSGPPFKDKLRPLTPPMKEELDSQLNDMLKHKVIRPSKSPWGAFPVFAQKKNGKWRMALNYVRLNKQMKPDAYPLPRLWDLVQESAHHVYYTVIDCNWGFLERPTRGGE